MTTQSGTLAFTNGRMVRSVIDRNPKQQMVIDPPYGSHSAPVARPPGGSYKVTFPDANTMVLQDMNLNGTLTCQRAQ